ncbi:MULTISPECIES: YjzC family protein [Staphylococcus]|uniref:YjzC family protein n=1 Tax=Staphylococcus cohnii TaxID=29382 RepID=A0ABT6J2U2_9STAP|nr:MULTISPECIES: YjzC family protein [Staphylococcus]MDH5140541.1 YjzC family protein [Staphylococcus cohnii]MDH5159067.1 YjzC family protein [Staphylococcus cohnii]MDH5170125.1 YjzC family protein [Staphylococcus cohnii]MDK9850169.1 YjzC family protein [Staphylococcus equorum]
MTNNNSYKTGEKAPESGTYKVHSLASGNSSNQDNTEIEVEKGEQFPPSPSSNEAAYWEKA